MVGKTISQYRILEEVGRGGMSQISPRTLFVSGWKFEDPTERPVRRSTSEGGSEVGGVV